MIEPYRVYKVRKRRKQVYVMRLILTVSACFLVFAFRVFYGGSFADVHSSEASVSHKYYKSIEIKSGDTLWNIAEMYVTEEYDSVDAYVRELKDINGLHTDDIQDSQYLMVAYYEKEW